MIVKEAESDPRAAVEVVLRREDDRLVLLDALNLVRPLAGDLDRSLDGFSARVHHERHLESGELWPRQGIVSHGKGGPATVERALAMADAPR